MSNELIYNKFFSKNREAEAGGGDSKIRLQHENGKMTARERIKVLSWSWISSWLTVAVITEWLKIKFRAMVLFRDMAR